MKDMKVEHQLATNLDDVDVAILQKCTVRASRMELHDGTWARVETDLLREIPLTLFINGNELVTVLCTPSKLIHLVIGFLHLEGIISSVDEIALLRVCEDENVADVRLTRAEVVLPARRTLTSGCGGGIALEGDWRNLPEVDSRALFESWQIQWLCKLFQGATVLYRRCGGVHTSALANSFGLVAVAEDVGRHNTIDKIQGECLLSGKNSGNHILFTTGRISSEMLVKAVKMAVPIVVSRSAPTDRAVEIARAKGITLVGYARGSRMSVYTHAWRLLDCPGVRRH